MEWQERTDHQVLSSGLVHVTNLTKNEGIQWGWLVVVLRSKVSTAMKGVPREAYLKSYSLPPSLLVSPSPSLAPTPLPCCVAGEGVLLRFEGLSLVQRRGGGEGSARSNEKKNVEEGGAYRILS